jgi:phosphohistidine swiveling domain-containing protein
MLDWSSLSDDQVVMLMRELEAFCCFRYLFITNPQHVVPLENKLRSLLSHQPDPQAALGAITVVNLPLPFDDEQREIAQLRARWNTLSAQEHDHALHGLVEKYGWFGGIEGEEPYDKNHYEREILSSSQERPAVTDVDVSDEARELGQLIGKLSNIRFWCRYHGMSIRYCIKLCLEELGRRWKKPDMLYLTVPEACSAKDTDYERVIRARKQGYVATFVGGEPTLFTGTEMEPYLEKVKEHIQDVEEFSGRPAYPGLVRGTARIVSFTSDDYHEQVEQFRQGEVLVTGMTRPQIAHLCNKASAIITDEGGITSHAATIAREFRIPCVIGTHIATKVLRTGDTIEVDAAKGSIRKLPKTT